CEFFATSMALLLRYQGIPARVVNGFLEGEYNEIGDFYLVRQSDAHTWVEVYIDGAWYGYDPSPRALPSAETRIWIDFRKIFDSISYFWDRYILIFSAEDQINAINTIRDRYQEFGEKLRQKSEHGSRAFSNFKNQWRQHSFAISITAVLLTFF